MQMNAPQRRSVLAWYNLIAVKKRKNKIQQAEMQEKNLENWLKFKEFEGSDLFALKALEHSSLSKLINQLMISINK
jgi:hypothetical protein